MICTISTNYPPLTKQHTVWLQKVHTSPAAEGEYIDIYHKGSTHLRLSSWLILHSVYSCLDDYLVIFLGVGLSQSIQQQYYLQMPHPPSQGEEYLI